MKIFYNQKEFVQYDSSFEFFTNSPQHEHANIANLVLAVPLNINKSNNVCSLEM